MKLLSVEILAGEIVVGSADLRSADPTMGVAYAIFRPGPAYDARRHARGTEQQVLDTSPTPLEARTLAGARLKCASVDLEDFSETLGDEGREVWILGLEDFQIHFD